MRFLFIALGFTLAQLCNAQKPSVDTTIGSRFTATDVSEFLEHHNMARKEAGSLSLAWDANLAAYAQKWANYLADSVDCDLWHRRELEKEEGRSYGECLFMCWPAKSVKEASIA